MQIPEFLQEIHIGKIIHAEMKQRHLTNKMLADKIDDSRWVVRKLFQQKSIKINKLIEISYAMGINLLDVYLREMPLLGNTESFADEIKIIIINEQVSIIPSKRSRSAHFLSSIHIGKIIKQEIQKQNIMEKTLSDTLSCSQSTVSRIFSEPDIDIERLILFSYQLDYDFIRNIYLPYIGVDEKEMIANDMLSNTCEISINSKSASVITEKRCLIYHVISSKI
jgi:ribosome-binding protein aMBF1 (putative translation factor)